jgi:hypothetical protein
VFINFSKQKTILKQQNKHRVYNKETAICFGIWVIVNTMACLFFFFLGKTSRNKNIWMEENERGVEGRGIRD